ncbi:phosphotransferase [Rhodohalobacter mucosus]|uniref:Choline kinase n=1 Tax=Rhodohalobacter mucosus TaxID=2079485 RepID=A0A316TQR5_9BACT|nr:phosphotransferase [Rhodohalobacter mucosus]PWN06031.1 choline kinase [Rhodohalobacter mucosus]
MNERFKTVILESAGADSITDQQMLQELWSGYGKILRVRVAGGQTGSVVVKHIQTNETKQHPRGWNTDIGHRRKLRSYKVETHWYERYSSESTARVPRCLAVDHHGDDVLIVLEDLNVSGYPLRKSEVGWKEIDRVLKWLADFHSGFLGQTPDGLWEQGTYWHLETRPQEYKVLSDKRLKEAAPLIDQKLRSCTYKTFVHGDAKLANFCFSEQGDVAAVDFQYAGGGCGMKDVAYFIGSCLDEEECEALEQQVLDTYFKHLQRATRGRKKAIEAEWRSLYRVAWADFHRFLKGWSPGHWKINSYSERVTEEVISELLNEPTAP